MDNILAVITARGGSKGLPKKNILPMAGKPLIAHTIEASLGINNCRVIVSTDDKEIAEISKAYGAEVPFLRPAELSNDEASSIDVIKHAALFLEDKDNIKFDWVMLLQPTTPLRDKKDILSAIDLTRKNDCDSVVSVAKVTHQHPLLLKQLDENGFMIDFMKNSDDKIRRQNLTPDFYYRNGGIYLVKRDVLISENSLYGSKVVPYIMGENKSIDIDNINEFKLAELEMLSNT